jgi:hypothetical protein
MGRKKEKKDRKRDASPDPADPEKCQAWRDKLIRAAKRAARSELSVSGGGW